jgi:acyl-CoA reductase-like NAD-dependent aldehyde dehydrogenase
MNQPNYVSTNPASGEVAAHFDFASDEVVEQALVTGDQAYRSWRQVSVQDRVDAACKVGELFSRTLPRASQDRGRGDG